MNQEESNFWADVEKLITPPKTVTIEYRLYYNELGEIVKCSMIEHEDSGPYVVVTVEEYNNYFNYRVVDGKVKKIDKERSYSVKLTRSTIGYPTVKNHAGLIIEPVEEYREIEYYAHRNN